MKVYVGWDSREDIAYQVCEHSSKRRDPSAEVIPLKQNDILDSAIKIGWECIIGPGAVLTSCELDKNVIVGAGAVIGEGSIIEKNCHIAYKNINVFD